MAKLAADHPVTIALQKRDRIAAVVAHFRRGIVDDEDIGVTVKRVLERMPSITDDEIRAGSRLFSRELRAIRRPALIRLAHWYSAKAVLFVGSAALVAYVVMGWVS